MDSFRVALNQLDDERVIPNRYGLVVSSEEASLVMDMFSLVDARPSSCGVFLHAFLELFSKEGNSQTSSEFVVYLLV